MESLRLKQSSLRYWLYYYLILAGAFLCSNLSMAGGDSQHELTLLADPPFGYINTEEHIKFHVIVYKNVGDIVAAVRLIQTDIHGNPISEAGLMNDQGRDGDYREGDGRYTTTLTMRESNPVIRYYQSIVSLNNDSRKILSQARKFRITEEPFYKEYDEDKVVQTSSGSRFLVNRVLVELKEEDNRSTAEALARSVGGTVVGYTFISNEYSLEVPTETIEALEAMTEKLKSDSRTVDAGKAYIFRLDPLEPLDL